MSQPDSFIDEVTEEVRRDRLYGYLRRYGWIAVLAVLLIVGGAAWREYSAAQQEAAAQEFGSAIYAALDAETAEARAAALAEVEAPEGGAEAILAMLRAGEQSSAEGADAGNASETLNAVNASGENDIYRQIAHFKALTREGVDAQARQNGFAAMAEGGPLRLMAEEQLALLEIEAGETDAALTRLQGIRQDSEVTQGLRLRASQLIVALGGSIEDAS